MSRPGSRRRAAGMAGAGLLPALLAAGAGAPAAAQEPVEMLSAVPETPAVSFLSAAPARVDRPGSVRDLGFALLSGITPVGTVRQGFAFDASVWTLVPGLSIPLERYRGSPLAYALANTQLSVATARTSGDAADTDVALGLRTTLFDRGDPMADPALTRTLGDDILRTCAPSAPGEGTNAACVDSVTAATFARHSREHWNGARLSVAAAVGGRLEGSRFDAAGYAGLDAWAVGGLPLGGWGQVAGQLQVSDRPRDAAVPPRTLWSWGARAFVGTGTVNGFAEVTGVSGGGPDEVAPDDPSDAWSAGVEFRVASNTWLSTGVGRRWDAIEEAGRAVVVANLRWGMTSRARLESLRPGGPPGP